MYVGIFTYFEREREREREGEREHVYTRASEGGTEREGGRESQTNSTLSAQSLTHGLRL